ncbi:MAG: AcrR family transcriptional regulator [Myxococcota bacterium]|jgi:AcrR family transcriptional regulator
MANLCPKKGRAVLDRRSRPFWPRRKACYTLRVTPVRETKKAATRRRLVRCALRLYAKQGFDHTTVDEIAERAGVSRRTFFRYFESKEATVFAEHAERLERLVGMLGQQQADADPMALVRLSFLGMAGFLMSTKEDWFAQHRVVIQSRALMAYDIGLEAHWEAAIAAALGDRRGNTNDARRRARLLSGATLGMIRAILAEWFESGGDKDLVALGRRAVELVSFSAVDSHLTTPVACEAG